MLMLPFGNNDDNGDFIHSDILQDRKKGPRWKDCKAAVSGMAALIPLRAHVHHTSCLVAGVSCEAPAVFQNITKTSRTVRKHFFLDNF